MTAPGHYDAQPGRRVFLLFTEETDTDREEFLGVWVGTVEDSLDYFDPRDPDEELHRVASDCVSRMVQVA